MPLSSSRADAHLQFLDHLTRESARFRAALAEADPQTRVPTCPDWDADDLLWHLGEVQWFWGEIAETGVTSADQLEGLNRAREPRPSDRAGLLACYDRSSQRLHRALGELPPETERWMWADDHSAGYIARRQAHEALIHRVDAELTGGGRTPLDPALAADGVDEVLTVMRGYEDEAGLTATALSGPVLLKTIDTGHTWMVTPVRVFGTDRDGDDWDLARFRLLGTDDGHRADRDGHAAQVVGDASLADHVTGDHQPTGDRETPGADREHPTPVARISATASDLDCWLWNRPPLGPVTRAGDADALAAVDRVREPGID